MPDRKLKNGGVDGFLYKKFPANIISGTGRLAINITADKIHTANMIESPTAKVARQPVLQR